MPIAKRLFSKFGNPAPSTQVVDNFWDYSVFTSYGTRIAEAHRDGKVLLFPEWDFSNTTGQYLNQFLGVKGRQEIKRRIRSGEYTLVDEDGKPLSQEQVAYEIGGKR